MWRRFTFAVRVTVMNWTHQVAQKSPTANKKTTITEASKKHKLGRRSLYVYKQIKKGDKFSEKNIKSVRPAYGLAPKNIKRIIGRKAARDLDVGERVTWNVVE